MKPAFTLFFALAFSAAALSPAHAKDASKDRVFYIDDARNTVHFLLDAPFEAINGTTNEITGEMKIAGTKASGKVTVPVSSLKTGISKRDEHLQGEKWMNAKKHPNLVVEFSDLTIPEGFWKGEKLEAETKGKFSIHGVTRAEPIKVSAQYLPESELTQKRLPGNLVRIRTTFNIKLKDYEIAQSDSAVKSLIGLKVGETAEVSTDLMASDKKGE